MVAPIKAATPNPLALQVRQHLVAQATQMLAPLLLLVRQRLLDLLDQAAPSREMQERRDTWNHYQRHSVLWQDGTTRAWQNALRSGEARTPRLSLDAGLELVGTDVVENRIIASRLALGVMEKAATQVNDLRKRAKALQGDQELVATDIVHPETLILPLIEQWVQNGFSRESWSLVHDTVQQHLNQQLQRMYASCNEQLIARGVLPVIELVARPGAPAAQVPSQASAPVARVTAPPARTTSPRHKAEAAEPANSVGSVITAAYQGVAQSGYVAASVHSDVAGTISGQAGRHIPNTVRAPRERAGRMQVMLDRIGQMIGTGGSPVKQGFADTVINAFNTPTLIQAIDQQQALRQDSLGEEMISFGDAVTGTVHIARVVDDLRQQSTALKEQAQTDSEKAIIELVALMFQSILQEDRLPPGIRVWFARLQMPVLRIALAEPDFFSRLNHPARQLIDHMGSCVMGFDASGISSTALEAEIKRVVQVTPTSR